MKWKHVLLIAGMFGVYLFLASRSIHEPLLGDSYASVFSAENMYAGKPFTAFHPLLYYASLNVVMHGGGGSPESYRIVGILGFLATLLLLIYLTRSVTGDTTAGLMAGALYAIHPMAVKGSLITDIDTTILPPLLLLFIIVFRKLESRMNIRSCLFLAFLLTIALWAKESTPLLLAAALVMYYFLQRKYGEGIVVGGTVAVAASLLFLVSWVSVPRLVEAEYSLVAPVANITGALKGSNIVTGKDASIAGSMRTLARLTLWLTPGFVGLLLMAFFDQAKAFLRGRKDTFTMYLAVYAALVLVAYLYIGRIAFGFPKYHYPLVSVGCVLLAITFAPFIKTLQKREILVSLAVGAFAALIYVFCVGDILYATDYAVREALAMNRFGWDRLCTVALQAGGYFLIIPAVFLALRCILGPRNIRWLLTATLGVSMLSAAVACDILQYRADYATVYCYGAQPGKGFFEFLKEQHRAGKRLLCPSDISYCVAGNKARLSYNCNNPDILLAKLKRDDPDCFVYGIGSNTLAQCRDTFNDPALIKYLGERFEKKTYGSYVIWAKKAGDK